jgi:hypothetical protein
MIAVMMACALTFAACESHEQEPSTSGPTRADSTSATSAPAEHEHHAPHGGSLVEIGEEFAHLELVLDPDEGKLTIYALDGEAEKSVRLKQSSIAMGIVDQGSTVNVELLAVANVLSGETIGDSSQFEAVIDSLRTAKKFQGEFAAVTIKGQTFEHVKFDFALGATGHEHKKK